MMTTIMRSQKTSRTIKLKNSPQTRWKDRLSRVGYLRQVTTGRAAERAGKFKQTENDGKIEVTLADGTVMKVDNFDDALRVSQINTDGHTLNPEAMSSLTKKQA